MCSFEGAKHPTRETSFTISGGNDGEVTPVPIPNTEVKLSSADGTWTAGSWESKSSPDKCSSIAQSVEQRTENPRVPGSIPGLATIKSVLVN